MGIDFQTATATATSDDQRLIARSYYKAAASTSSTTPGTRAAANAADRDLQILPSG
jgi:hypothetical protein